jgi:hypothetical protein
MQLNTAEPDSCHKLYFFIGWSHSRLQMGSSEERQNPEQSPKMSSGFQCFVWGSNSVQMKRE